MKKTTKKEKSISPEDREVLKSLDILEKIIGGLMASVADVQAKVESLKVQNAVLLGKVDTLETEMTSAFNRLEEKIAAGFDTQPVIDVIDAVSQAQTDALAKVESAIAQAQVTGV